MTTMHKYAIAGFVAALMMAGAAPLVLAAQLPECVRTDQDGANRTLDEWRACGNARIDQRITDLNAFMARIQAMGRLSGDTKVELAQGITAQITVMQGLKTQIIAATDVATLKPIVQSITKNYRIYMLYRPQVAVTANADKIAAVTALLRNLEGKFKTRVDAIEAAGGDVTALRASLAKLDANIASAESRAAQAVAKVKDLAPDQGDQTVVASNKQAISDARVLLDAALQDVGAARANAGDIRGALQAFKKAQ